MGRLVVGVVGAGNMGSGIAQKLAMEGAEVLLYDAHPEAVERGMGRIAALLDEGVERKVFTRPQADAVLGRLRPVDAVDALAACGLVIEAVFEDLGVKRRVFERLDAVCGPEVVLATNTSSFRVTDLQPGLRHPERLVGLHFFFHPAKNRLVEVIAGDHTRADVFDRAWAVMEGTGKDPIRSADAPGFIVNRFFVPWLNEAVRLHEEGVAAPGDIDAIAREVFGVGMGPFQLMNVTGVPIACHAANTLGEAFGAFYAPARGLERQVASGAHWELETSEAGSDPLVRARVAARLRAAAWIAAGQLVDEGVGSVRDVELGARVGLRWPRGPFTMAGEVGLDAALGEMEALARAWDLPLPTVFASRRGWGGPEHPFALPVVVTERRGDVAIISLDRPDKLNALSPQLVAELEAAWDAVEADPQVRGVVLRGTGKAFGAGADVEFFVRSIEAGHIGAITAFSGRAARLFNRIDASDKRVVALLSGLSLGGGSELALTADHIVATPKGSLGFPETGLGIYPGLGGTQRSTRRVGRPLARWLVLAGKPIDARTAFDIGLVDVFAPADQALTIALELARTGQTSADLPSRAAEPHALSAAAERLLGDTTAETWLVRGARDPQDAEALELEKLLSRKAPLALAEAARLVAMADRGGDVSRGLEAELEGIERMFATRDAHEGMKALLERRRPVFEGR